MVTRKTAIATDTKTFLLFPAVSIHGDIESDIAWRVVDGPPWATLGYIAPFCAVDFESYYDKAYSLETMSPWEYISHPAFQATIVSLEWYDGQTWRRWVGKIKDAPWHDIRGIEWWSHNAAFDELVARRLQRDFPQITIPPIWNCTADLAAYLQLDRGLASCAPILINETADKSVRARMSGGMAGAQESKDYAANDSRQCAWIRYAHGHRWPELESYLSRLQRRAGYFGIYADQKMMTEARSAMVKLMRDTEKLVPWANKHPVTSEKGFGLQCDMMGIPRPFSLSLDDKETEMWQKRYDTKTGWLEHVRNYTKAKQSISHIDMMKERTRKDGSVPFELIYRKAPHTARWQSGGGLRIQNLDRDPFNGYNPRWYISAFPNEDILSADLSQGEPRITYWLVQDTEFLDACRKGQSPYEAHARSTMGWTGGDLKKLSKGSIEAMALYALAKARVLALNYQAGPPKFVEMARTMAGITVFENEVCWTPDMKEFYRASQIKDRITRGDLTGWTSFPSAIDAVADFRSKSDKVVDAWGDGEDALRTDAGHDHVVQLPNGEVIYYFDVEVSAGRTVNYGNGSYQQKGDVTAWVVKSSRNPKNKKYLYGGKLLENKVQRVQRELLAHYKYRAAKELGPYGFRHMWSSHDEINGRSPKRESKYLMEALLAIMHTSPPWGLDLPVAAEGQILDHYVK